MTVKPTYYECGICGAMHSASFTGDCREDSARFDVDDLDANHGPNGWEEIAMDDLPPIDNPKPTRFLP